MAFTLQELHRKRRCQLGSIRSTFIAVLFLWFLCIFYEIYEIRKTEHEELGLLYGHALHSARDSHGGRSLQKRTKNVGFGLDQQHDNVINLKQRDKNIAVLHPPGVNEESYDAHKDPGSHPRKVQINNPPALHEKPNKKKNIVGNGHATSKDISSDNRTCEEYDWRKSPVPRVERIAVVPGGRWDKPRLGEFGKPVVINPSHLEPAENTEYQKDWDTHRFNEYASKRISIQRDVPDNRDPACIGKFDHGSNNAFPKASIIICFYNEAWSVLQRTVYSVFLRSPPGIVEEVILVDDHSDLDELKGPLEKFVAKTDKLRLLRMSKRSGLVKARLAGIDAANGPVLVFLDSHVECQEGWLEPLLHTIAHNPRMAVTPVIDVINEKTFSINKANGNIGVLDFNSFSFRWGPVVPRIKKMVKSDADAIQSPTMAGGLFAIRKDFFIGLGTYDPNLYLWGGENIELSLKLWLCGGGILIHPCSRVSHIFRDTSPYLTGKLAFVSNMNSARVAYVWADEYKQTYFKDKTFDSEEWKVITTDIQDRIDLRKNLGCKPFSWYLENVFPEMHIQGTGKFVGPIRSEMNGLCVDEEDQDGRLILVDCDGAVTWELTRLKAIRFEERCMNVYYDQNDVFSSECEMQDRSQAFDFDAQEQTLYHSDTKRCLTVGTDGRTLQVLPCVRYAPHQKWSWDLNMEHIRVP